MMDKVNTYASDLKNNKKEALDKLYEAYSLKLFNFSMSFLKNKEDAYDIVQEVFIKIWENRAQIKEDTNFESFLFTIVKNTVLTLFRKRSSEKKYLNSLSKKLINASENGEKEMDYLFLQDQYKDLVKQLPPKRQEIFILSREKGLTHKEIAVLKQVSVKTIEDHIRKALIFLKSNLDEKNLSAIVFYFLFIS